MARLQQAIDRYWSLAAALALPVVELLSEAATRGAGGYYEVVRAVLSVVCIGLLVHSWFMQRRYVRSKWRLAFLTLLLTLIALGPIWLGLNVMRAYHYPLNWAAEVARYENICDLQDRTLQVAKVLGLVAAILRPEKNCGKEPGSFMYHKVCQ